MGWLIIVAIVIVSELTVLASYLLKPKATEDKAATKLPVSAAEALQPEIPLSIICQPQNRVYVPGSCITLTLKAQGSDLRYQWYYKKPKQHSALLRSHRLHRQHGKIRHNHCH